MQPFFICSSIESVNYQESTRLTNNPVNLSVHSSVKKDNYKWYPDKVGLPSIVFVGLQGEDSVAWVYENQINRDADFEKIVSNNFSELQGTNIASSFYNEIDNKELTFEQFSLRCIRFMGK